MSDNLRYLVTVDSASGQAIRVEQVGEAGDLTEVDLAAFVQSLGASPGNPVSPQIVINIFAGEATPVAMSGGTARVAAQASNPMGHLGFTPAPPPPPPSPPPHKPGRSRSKK